MMKPELQKRNVDIVGVLSLIPWHSGVSTVYAGFCYFALQYGSLAGPFGPVVDGIVLRNEPRILRQDKEFMHIKVMAGVMRDDGAYLAGEWTHL